MSKISVIVPTYNSGSWLPETIASIQSQQDVEIEIVVVDDASTDDTPDVIARCAASNLRYLRLPENHGGPSRPRNFGLESASGDFIALFDSDDTMLPGYLARSLRFLTLHPEAGLVFSRGLRHSADGHLAPHLLQHAYPRFYRLPRREAGPSAWLLEREPTLECLFFENFILPSGVVAPRRVFEEVGPFDESLTNGDDRDLWFRIAGRWPLGYLEAYGFYYRVGQGGISGRGASLAENRIKVLRKHLADPISPAARQAAWRLIARNLYGIGYMHQMNGNMIAARRTYLESLDQAFNMLAARGFFITLLPHRGRRQLKALLALANRTPVTWGQKKVSVVVTCFNYGRYLGGCLESILAQTYQDLEIIVVNDGSLDDTDEVVAPFLVDPRITYIRQENKGQAAAKNTGIANAQGEFIAFLDADDQWEHDKLARQLSMFADPAVGVVYSRARFVNLEGEKIDFRLSGKYLIPRAGRVTEYLLMDNFVPFSSSVVRRECFDKVGCFDETLAMGIDWDLWLRISMHYEFDFIDRPLLIYRLGHPGQMSRNVEERQSCADRIMKNFLQLHSGEIAAGVVRKARAYTCCNRGNYFRHLDRPRSNRYFWEAIKLRPIEIGAYKGLLKNFLNYGSHIKKTRTS